MFFNDLFEDGDKSLKKNNPCWKGYHPVGTKQKAGKTVPNCVPENKELEEGAMKDLHTELADKYRELAPKIEKYKDSYLAGELYDALEAIATKHNAELEFKRMLAGARNRAHMDYDTNPGGFQNWFWYLPFEDDLAEDTKSDLYANAVKKIKSALATEKDPQVRSELEARLAKFQATESQLNELDPKQEEPATIDDRVKDLTARIGQLEKETPKTRKGEVGGLEKTSYGQAKDPAVKRLLRKAHELAPYASNDLEAVFRYFEKVVEKDDETIDMLVKNHKRNAALIKFLNQENDRQEQEIQQGNQIDADQEKKIKDLLDLMNAKEKRFQDYTTLVARSRGEYPQDMVQAAQTAQHVERTGRMPDEEAAPQGQQQANRQLQQSRYSKELAIRESVLDSIAHYYFKPIGTLPNDLTRVYGLEKDAKGWYLKQTGVSSTDFKNKLSAARRAFGEPEVVRQDMPVSRSGYTKLDRAGWQDKLSYARELERHPSMQDPILHQNVLNRIQELTKIGHDNGWL